MSGWPNYLRFGIPLAVLVAAALVVYSVSRPGATAPERTDSSARRSGVMASEPVPPVALRHPPAGTPDVPRPAPASRPTPADLAERAEQARGRPALESIAQRRQAAPSPCEAMLGVWIFPGDAELSLESAGIATWAERPGRAAQAVRWMCTQNGNAEVTLPEGTFRLEHAQVADSLESTDAAGRTVVARRAGR